MGIKSEEIWQLTKWTLLWVGSWFVAFNIREIIAQHLTTPTQQILFGLGVLAFVAYFWDIRKYNGRG